MKQLYFILFLIISVISCHNNRISSDLNDNYLNGLVEKLNNSEWSTVYKAKDTLESLGHLSIPYLIDNMNKKDRYVKLQNTADLIYPGATEFYGSGWVVDYDIDWLSIRSGWVLEEITFENFGFRECIISEDELIELAKDKDKYPDYIKTGKYDIKVSPQKKKQLKSMIKKVNNWWGDNSVDWNRLKGITDALESNDLQRQSDAIQYLRHGQFIYGHQYCIEELTREYFDEILRPTVLKLIYSPEEFISEDAKLLLRMVDYKGDFRFHNITTICWGE